MDQSGVIVTNSALRGFETGFGLLADAPGSYNLAGYGKIKVIHPGSNDSAMGAGFYAFLPVVFRNSGGRDYIIKAGQKRRLSDIFQGGSVIKNSFAGFATAEDKEGNAAFIGLGRHGNSLLFCRDDFPRPGESGFYPVTALEGLDVR